MKMNRTILALVLLTVTLALSVYVSPQAHASSHVSQTHTTTQKKNVVMHPSTYPTDCNGVTFYIVGLDTEGVQRGECFYGSGVVYPNLYTILVSTGNWSGYLYTTSGQIGFCDWQQLDFNYNTYVGSVYLSPSKEPFCP